MELDSGNPGGWIYLLMTSANYQRYKVGRTNQNPLIRFKQLRTADPCLDFEVAYFIPTSLGELSKVEAEIHRHLERRISFHDEKASEWFKGDVKVASELIEGFFENWWGCNIVTDCFRPNACNVLRAYEERLNFMYGPEPEVDENGIPWW